MLYLLGIIAGLALAMQSPINAFLGKSVKSPFTSSLFSFSIGTIFLSIVSLLLGGHFFDHVNAALAANQPWWVWIGGAFGVIYLTSNILMFPKLGAVQTVLLPTLGQILMSMVIETFGLFYVKSIPLSVTRIIGTIIMILGLIVAVALANYSKREQAAVKRLEAKETVEQVWFWRIWGVIAGALAAVQQALNGHLGTLLGSPVQSSMVSFLLGSLLILLYVIFKQRRFLPKDFSFKNTPNWAFIGGILGSTFVLTSAFLIPQLGPGLTIALGIIGTLLGAIIVQQFGLFKSAKHNAKILQIVGIAIMAVGIVIIKVF